MIKGGKGGGNTTSGLKFEGRVSLEKAILKIPGFSVVGRDVFRGGVKVAELFGKHSLYSQLLSPRRVDYSALISKRLLPDEAVLVGTKLFIIELKFQGGAGSVDEKLQTCHFKQRQYVKLVAPLGLQVQFVYVLNDWFRKPEYRDVLNYIEEVGCRYFFDTIPIDYLGLTGPTSAS